MSDAMERLIVAIEKQTDAISRLADSNQALVAIVIDGEDDELQRDAAAPHGRYQDGTPIPAGG